MNQLRLAEGCFDGSLLFWSVRFQRKVGSSYMQCIFCNAASGVHFELNAKRGNLLAVGS